MAVNPPISPKFRTNVAGYSAESVRRWVGSGTRWGAFAGIAALFVVSQVPIVKRSILQNAPVLGWYWKVEEEKK
ncbi:hypothetical protein GGI25_001886 [Coemansia spiralis]|uniref:Uncharacterized protein n=2 Tax=Coemansia TaxID=4863 RepID=A0A9W8G9M9_9FUNG|nr:hypothetical protein BX070DRAFT_224886 [Coemansia spiralis]KAJ1993320.1 hypothetical protein EDC05_002184 [Coemansia umbellata]KAJ2623532.1 hypothetical protein GGI26_002371 [Coemansia sp. RSA 1358]KAJ2678897.1 hypothetical protein GGI25_001886 [Coemansia spiralis]